MAAQGAAEKKAPWLPSASGRFMGSSSHGSPTPREVTVSGEGQCSRGCSKPPIPLLKVLQTNQQEGSTRACDHRLGTDI